MKKYGYCRVSTPKQNIERQVRNIQNSYPDAIIIKEVYTGSTFQGRKELDKLISNLNSGDVIIFDSVSRMSRNAEEGFNLYEELFRKDITLIFLKEPHINTDTYKNAMTNQVRMTGDKVDLILEGLNRYLLELEKAVDDGVDVKGYFQWSLMDNFEWAKGYNDRFGLIYIDYETQERIPKDSYYWYKNWIEEHTK